ncbi:MAG: hypothetical protein WAK17_22990 [Candidatus Nitrosopolaris sp.]|jgi:hypothetical protein
MGRSVGISDSNYKPTETELLEVGGTLTLLGIGKGDFVKVLQVDNRIIIEKA